MIYLKVHNISFSSNYTEEKNSLFFKENIKRNSVFAFKGILLKKKIVQMRVWNKEAIMRKFLQSYSLLVSIKSEDIYFTQTSWTG